MTCYLMFKNTQENKTFSFLPAEIFQVKHPYHLKLSWKSQTDNDGTDEGGVELLWGKCTVFPDLGTGDTDRWRINLHLCATCQYPLNQNWKNCAIAPK